MAKKDGFSRRELLQLTGKIAVTIGGSSMTASLLTGCGDDDDGGGGGTDAMTPSDAFTSATGYLDYYLAQNCSLGGTADLVDYLYCDDYVSGLDCRYGSGFDQAYVDVYGAYPNGRGFTCAFVRAE